MPTAIVLCMEAHQGSVALDLGSVPKMKRPLSSKNETPLSLQRVGSGHSHCLSVAEGAVHNTPRGDRSVRTPAGDGGGCAYCRCEER